MRSRTARASRISVSLAAVAATCLCLSSASARSAEASRGGNPWIELIGTAELDAWRKVDRRLVVAGDAELAAADAKKLSAKAGSGVLVAETKAKIPDLVTEEAFGDCELHLEFLLAKGSNSGVKLHEHYEIQLYDSHGKEKLHGSDCGGVYPRWHWSEGRFTYLDDGVPPRVNAARPAGQWQTLDVVFRAPRFDAEGRKTEHARLVVVRLNGVLIHENVELKTPTGYVSVKAEEVLRAPLLIQVNHGPVALRNVRVRPVGAI